MKMDYNSKEFKENQEENDTEYLLKEKSKVIHTNPKPKQYQIQSIHDPISLNYGDREQDHDQDPEQDQHNPKDLLNLNDNNKEIEITPVLKEDYTLLTLNNISHCQSCKEKFNSKRNAPYLLPCNHFFCKKCIEGFSTGSYAINCPIDGRVANSFSELTLLSNLLNKGRDSSESALGDYCLKHPDQKLSHFVEETREVICVYCAFNLMKTNPQYHIKEIEEKCAQLITNLDQVLENNQQYAEGLQGALDVIKKNKGDVDEKIIHIYDSMIHYLNEKKEEQLKKTEAVFSENAFALSEKLDYFSGNIELAEKVREELQMNKSNVAFSQSVNKYDSVINETNNNSKLQLVYKELNFTFEDEKKIMRTISNFSQLTSQGKAIVFGEEKSNNNNNIASTVKEEKSIMTESNKMKKYQDEMYIETSNDKPLKQYLVPEAICRTSGSNYSYEKPYDIPSSSSKSYINTQTVKPKQYIVTNTNSNINNTNPTINTKNASFGSKSQIGFNHSQISSGEGLNLGYSLAYDYRKKRDLSFDKNEYQ